MQRARAGLHHNSFSGRKVTNRKDTIRLDPKILRESSVLRHAVGPKIQAHEKVTAQAIKAFATCFVAIPNDSLTFLEVLHGWPEKDNFAGKFMPWDQGETWTKLPLMDVEIRAADPAGMDSNQHVVGFNLWFGHVLILEFSRSFVDDGFHLMRKDLGYRS